MEFPGAGCSLVICTFKKPTFRCGNKNMEESPSNAQRLLNPAGHDAQAGR